MDLNLLVHKNEVIFEKKISDIYHAVMFEKWRNQKKVAGVKKIACLFPLNHGKKEILSR